MIGALHTEVNLEAEIVRELCARGWIEGDPAGYDRDLALYRKDVIGWLLDSQPEALATVIKANNGSSEQLLLERLAKTIETDGTLGVLRRGFKRTPAAFYMCTFKPSSGLNPDARVQYEHVRCRVVRQVRYSKGNEKSIDLVFFINGIPIATAEIKTEMTQAVEAAITQYKMDRKPKDASTNRSEPLLTPKRGALVHFAMSDDEVYMTTELAGSKTVFLPFNMGHDGGKGNPPNPGKAKTAYMWERILERDNWLEMVDRFIHIEKGETEVDGKKNMLERVIFPRYHQWETVKALITHAKAERAGHKYLIQHSAGSGKSNSIMWLGHRLSTLHDDTNTKVFDSIIVVTDRRLLDRQLQENIFQYDHKLGVVVHITDTGESKSAQLRKALDERVPIIVVTVQVFPALMKRIDSSDIFRDRTYAIIADEAHSSQTGKSADGVKITLGLSDDEPKSAQPLSNEDAIARDAARRANSKNISYFAFTATPKPRTMQLFGRKNAATGQYDAFRIYSMKQAIEEGFILDVLQNYIPYDFYYKLAAEPQFGDLQVPKSEAAKVIARMAKLHPANIGQRVEIVVEHFHGIVQQRLNGKAKAMVVTDSRKAAVKYKLAMDEYIKKRGYSSLRTIVAFSGDVTGNEWPDQTFKESKMNQFPSSEIPERFGSDDYHVLIVAEKFQTGFDQPLLCAMYVDKKLADINAVQTLSRLNRTFERGGIKKTAQDVFILDFVNDADDILLAFRRYYKDVQLSEGTNPDLIHDLRAKLDAYGIYDDSDVGAYVAAYFDARRAGNDAQKQTTLKAALDPSVDRWEKRISEAKQRGDSEDIARALIFRHDLTQFNRAFAFLSQIYNYADTDLERHAIFYSGLVRLLHNQADDVPIDVSGISLTYIENRARDKRKLELDEGDQQPLNPQAFVGTAKAHAVSYGPLAEVIELLNNLYAPDITEDDKVKFTSKLDATLLSNDTLKTQATNNNEEQFEKAGSFKMIFDSALIETKDIIEGDNERQNVALNRLMDALFADKDTLERMRSAAARRVHKYFNE